MKEKTIKKKVKKLVTVRAHPRRVPISEKNPDGLTIVDRHKRQILGVSKEDIKKVIKEYIRAGLILPTRDALGFNNGNKYDEIIAILVDYFNQKFNIHGVIDPNLVKALIAGESGFRTNTPKNKIAFGIAQITLSTLKILQDEDGEAREYTFKNISKNDLLDAETNLALGVRWLYRKRDTAKAKLGREPTPEELILEYKGLLNSSTKYKDQALKNFREHYGKLIIKK